VVACFAIQAADEWAEGKSTEEHAVTSANDPVVAQGYRRVHGTLVNDDSRFMAARDMKYQPVLPVI